MVTPKPQRGGLERKSSLNWQTPPGTMTNSPHAACHPLPHPGRQQPTPAFKQVDGTQEHRKASALQVEVHAHGTPKGPAPPDSAPLARSEIRASGRAPFRFQPIEGASSTSIRAGSGSTAAAARAPAGRAGPPLPRGPTCYRSAPALAPSSPRRTGDRAAGERGELRGKWPLGRRPLVLGASAPCPGRRARARRPRAAHQQPRRRVRKELQSECRDRLGSLRRLARPLSPQPAPSLSWQLWKCLLSWFSQSQHKSHLLPVPGARCCTSLSKRTVLGPQRLRVIIPQGTRRPAPARGFLPRSQLPAGLAEAIWGVVCAPAGSLSTPCAGRSLKGRPRETKVPFLFAPPILRSLVAHRPRGTPLGAASLPPALHHRSSQEPPNFSTFDLPK